MVGSRVGVRSAGHALTARTASASRLCLRRFLARREDRRGPRDRGRPLRDRRACRRTGHDGDRPVVDNPLARSGACSTVQANKLLAVIASAIPAAILFYHFVGPLPVLAHETTGACHWSVR